jgi:hypothetical protein
MSANQFIFIIYIRHNAVCSLCMMVAHSLVPFRVNITFPSAVLHFYTLKLEAVCASRSFVSVYLSGTLCRNPDTPQYVHCCLNLKSCLWMWLIAVDCS